LLFSKGFLAIDCVKCAFELSVMLWVFLT
jgi:hypothetical protein